MEPNQSAPMPAQDQNVATSVCPICHQSVSPEYYFCPNCGNKLHQAPLKTDSFTQAWIYLFSIILPMLCFLFITRWPGLKYYRSEDRKTKLIGMTAFVLLFLSTFITIWLAYVWTQQQIQATTDEINADMSF